MNSVLALLSKPLVPLKSEAADLFVFPPQWIPDPIVWSNFIKSWEILPFGKYLFKNGIFAQPIRFPTVNIDDGQASISLGAEAFSTANLLNQDVITITNNLELYSGKHTFTIGTHNEFYSSTNLFIRQNYGQYEYLNPQGFLNNDPNALDIYFRSYSLLTEQLGDNACLLYTSDAADE